MGRRTEGTPREPGYISPPKPDKRLIYRRAESGTIVAYTPEQYGVRKDRGDTPIDAYNTSRGLLVLAILLSICMCALIWPTVVFTVQGTWGQALGQVWWVYLAGAYFFTASWSYYFKERRAEKLRDSHNLPRPVE